MNSSKQHFAATVLLVDDDSRQLELRALILCTAGFSVLTASGPMEALAVVGTTSHIDIAVVDYDMPIMNGAALAECLKSKLPGMDVVLYSGAQAIPLEDMKKADALIHKAEGVIVLIRHLRRLSAQITAARSRAEACAPCDNPEPPAHSVAKSRMSPTVLAPTVS